MKGSDASIESQGDFTESPVTTPEVQFTGRTLTNTVIFLAAAMMVTLAASLAIDRTENLFEIPDDLMELAGNPPYSNEVAAEIEAAVVVAEYRNTPLALGLAGLAAGSVFAMTAGLRFGGGRCAPLA